uniref:C3H1-type domain-containing protein n=1 Tax=Chromera velia CCMP2878 TaxID=1169474 RepID=A0A0G4H8A2_9ALVE|eukprot:Cvel_861.t1-p1 / transcript=Cvel_861.t1 / gene=Cvel_861 / organism=Chromera_velia_CCMP2878 / gene_product=hypothetical protein / transcript_product=hypothetical protein / location=Cvel_scaffold27:14665-21358(-) / protein_length=639 / sequence_SO=supercontig / SO=protein_coding / is_pseudo=false
MKGHPCFQHPAGRKIQLLAAEEPEAKSPLVSVTSRNPFDCSLQAPTPKPKGKKFAFRPSQAACAHPRESLQMAPPPQELPPRPRRPSHSQPYFSSLTEDSRAAVQKDKTSLAAISDDTGSPECPYLLLQDALSCLSPRRNVSSQGGMSPLSAHSSAGEDETDEGRRNEGDGETRMGGDGNADKKRGRIETGGAAGRCSETSGGEAEGEGNGLNVKKQKLPDEVPITVWKLKGTVWAPEPPGPPEPPEPIPVIVRVSSSMFIPPVETSHCFDFFVFGSCEGYHCDFSHKPPDACEVIAFVNRHKARLELLLAEDRTDRWRGAWWRNVLDSMRMDAFTHMRMPLGIQGGAPQQQQQQEQHFGGGQVSLSDAQLAAQLPPFVQPQPPAPLRSPESPNAPSIDILFSSSFPQSPSQMPPISTGSPSGCSPHPSPQLLPFPWARQQAAGLCALSGARKGGLEGVKREEEGRMFGSSGVGTRYRRLLIRRKEIPIAEDVSLTDSLTHSNSKMYDNGGQAPPPFGPSSSPNAPPFDSNSGQAAPPFAPSSTAPFATAPSGYGPTSGQAAPPFAPSSAPPFATAPTQAPFAYGPTSGQAPPPFGPSSGASYTSHTVIHPTGQHVHIQAETSYNPSATNGGRVHYVPQ